MTCVRIHTEGVGRVFQVRLGQDDSVCPLLTQLNVSVLLTEREGGREGGGERGKEGGERDNESCIRVRAYIQIKGAGCAACDIYT